VGTQEVWHAGEDVAAAYLTGLGWQVLARNWRCRAGELDIIALEPGPPAVVVFCEVKCRRGLGFGQPLEAITAAKRAKLRDLAVLWLREQPRPVPRFRIDGLGVLLPLDGRHQVTHLRGIG